MLNNSIQTTPPSRQIREPGAPRRAARNGETPGDTPVRANLADAFDLVWGDQRTELEFHTPPSKPQNRRPIRPRIVPLKPFF